MEALTLALGIALVAALWWVFILRQRQQVVAPLPPRQDSLKPLFDAAAASIDAGLLILDEARRVRYLNPQAEVLLRISDPHVGQGLITILRDYQVDGLVVEVLRDGDARGAALRAGVLHGHEGKRIKLQHRAAPIRKRDRRPARG